MNPIYFVGCWVWPGTFKCNPFYLLKLSCYKNPMVIVVCSMTCHMVLIYNKNIYSLNYQMCRECASALIKGSHFMKVLADVKTTLQI